MKNAVITSIQGWVPYRLFEAGGERYCRWLFVGDVKFSEPFFEETIVKCLKFPENSHQVKCVSNLEILPEWAEVTENVSPAVIIFHISRCGSTLLSQLLGIQPANIVLSEVPFFDELLRNKSGKRENRPARSFLKAAIDLHAARRNAAEQHLIIKTDSWHVHFYREFRKLYPQVPVILLYRNPAEVIRSQQKRRGMQSIPGLLAPEIFGFDQKEILHLTPDEYMARVIETYLRAFIDIVASDKNALLINYNEGPICMVKKVAEFSGLTIRDAEFEAMRQRSAFHGKFPEQIFEEAKTPEMIPEYLHAAFEKYRQLEEINFSYPPSTK